MISLKNQKIENDEDKSEEKSNEEKSEDDKSEKSGSEEKLPMVIIGRISAENAEGIVRLVEKK